MDREPAVDKLFNQSLEKGLAVLRAFGPTRRTMTIGEIADVVGINRSSAQRMVYTLQQLGYLRAHSKTRRYQLTVRSLQLGFDYLSMHPLIGTAIPFLIELSNFTQETVCLTEPDDGEMVYIARFVSARYIPIHMPTGSRIPMYCTGSGRAILSALPEDEARDVLARQPIRAHTVHTCTDVDALMDILRAARTRGYAINKEELFLGDTTMAAPVLNSKKRPVAAVHVVVPTSRWVLREAEEKMAPALLACARSLTNAMRTVDD